MSYSQHRRKSASGVASEGMHAMRGSRTSADCLPIQHSSPFASRRLRPIRQQMKETQNGKPSLFEATISACAEYRQRFVDKEIMGLKNPSQVEMIDARDFLGTGEYCLVNQITPMDIREGSVLKLQSFAVALSLLCEQPGLILRVFSELELNEYGVNSVWLYHQSCWQEVVVDELVPVFGDKAAIEFAYCRTSQDELWIVLVEKALAKLHGGYNNLELMDVNQVLTEITGASFLNFGLQSSLSLKDTFLSWEELSSYCSAGHLVYAVSNPLDRITMQSGFLPGMCYSVVGTAIVETQNGQKEHLVKVRVVWGEPGWQHGNWSPTDPAWNIKRNRLVAEYDSAVDGVYCLSFNDFNMVFERIAVFFVSDSVKSSCITLGRTIECQRDSSIFDVAEEGDYIVTIEQNYSATTLGGLISADEAYFWPVKCFLVSVVGKHSAIVETTLSIGQRYTVIRCSLLPGRFMLISDIYGKHEGISDQKIHISLKTLHSARLQPICPIQLSYAQNSDALYQAFKNLVSQYSGLFGNLKILRPVHEFGASGSPEVIISSSVAADDQIGIQIHKFSLSGPLEANSVYCMNLAVQLTAGELLCPNLTDGGCSITVTTAVPTGYLIFNLDPRASLGQTFQFKLQLTSITEVLTLASGGLDQTGWRYALGASNPSEMSKPAANFDLKQFLSRVKPATPSRLQQPRGQATKLLGKHTRELQAIAEGQEPSKQNPCGDCNLV